MNSISIMNPFSNKYHACQDFKKLNFGQKALTIVTIALVSLVTLGIGTSPVFRAMVNSFSKLNVNGDKKHEKTGRRVDEESRRILTDDKQKKSDKEVATGLNSKEQPEQVFPNIVDPNPSLTSQESDKHSGLTISDPMKEGSIEEEDGPVEGTLTVVSSEKKDSVKTAFDGKAYIASLGRKPKEKMSKRTLQMRTYIGLELAKVGKQFIETKDDGDCFFDSIAQKLSLLEGKPISVKDVRMACRNYIQELEKGPEEANWVKKSFGKGSLDENYESFRDKVQFTTEEIGSLKLGAPVWGDALAARIISKVYDVKVISHGLNTYEINDTEPNYLEDLQQAMEDNRFVMTHKKEVLVEYEAMEDIMEWDELEEDYTFMGQQKVTKYKNVNSNCSEIITIFDAENASTFDERDDKSDDTRVLEIANYQAGPSGHVLAVVDLDF